MEYTIKATKGLLFSGFLLVLITLGCERVVDNLEEPNYTTNPEVFIDGFSSGLEYYPYEGSRLDAFSVENEDTYNNSSLAMRFDVPNEGDPKGSYAGAIFRDENGGRDLTSYNALTFYAKGTKAGTINDIGFGQDFFGDNYSVTLSDLKLTTNWEKYIIPIPNASVLTSSQGLFWYAEGPENGDGYSFWIDELKYENLGTIAQPRPSMFDGRNDTLTSFIGYTTDITDLTHTVNLGSGEDVTVKATPAYFNFNSSDPSVASVDEGGEVSVVGSGTAVISATLDGQEVNGSLTIESIGIFSPAPTPDEDPADVISIFSDTYDNVPVDYYNGFFNGDGQTTLGGVGENGADIIINGNGIINYTDLNFVGIGTFLDVPSIDATEMTHFHVDINVREEIERGDFIRLQLINSVGNGETSGVFTIDSNTLKQGEWVSLDIPLNNFSGLSDRSQLGLIFFISDETISNIFVDNIYYYDSGIVIPVRSPPSFPITFDDLSIDYTFTVFEGTSFQVIDNPILSGSNATSSKVGSITNVGRAYEGSFVQLDNSVNLANGSTITMDVYSETAIPVLFKFEDGDNGAPDAELTANHSGSGWEELTFNFSSSAAYGRIVIFMDGPGTTSGIFYIDNIAQN